MVVRPGLLTDATDIGGWLEHLLHLPGRTTEDVLEHLIRTAGTAIIFDQRDRPRPGNEVVVGLEPDCFWELKDGVVTVRASDGSITYTALAATECLNSLRPLIERGTVAPPGYPPWVGGMLGYIGYDAVSPAIDRSPASRDVLGLPDACFVRPTIFLRLSEASDGVRVGLIIRAETSQARDILALMAGALDRAASMPVRKQQSHKASAATVRTSMSFADYEVKFEVAMGLIRAGGLQQVGLSRRFELDFEGSVVRLYSQLVQDNPSPLNFLLLFDDFSVVGTSPRMLAQVQGGVVTTKPIGGTVPRPPDRRDDQLAAQRLCEDPKEVEEHLMLLRDCVTCMIPLVERGHVDVVDKLRPEFFSHVIHLGSAVSGTLASGLGPIDVMAALSPASTVVGIPRAAAMQAVAALEDDRRAIYGGCVGYFSAAGEAAMYIAIRTAVVKDHTLYVQAGAGIVAGSDVASEYAEMQSKVNAILEAASASRA